MLTTAVIRFGSTGGLLGDVNGSVTQLLRTGRVRRATAGVVTRALTAELARAFGATGSPGLVVADVIPGEPAASAVIRPGELLLAFENLPLRARSDLTRARQRRFYVVLTAGAGREAASR